jgi:hypothetical protein
LPLLEAYRLFLVNHLAGARCADDEMLRPLTEGTVLALAGGFLDPQSPTVVRFFNEHLQVSPLEPLTETDVTPSHVEGRAVGLEGCSDAGCKAAAGLYPSLYTDGKGGLLSDAQRRTPEWRASLHQFLDAVSHRWKDSAEDAGLKTFTEKCEYYAKALEMAQDPADKELAAHAWLDYVEQSDAARGVPAVRVLPIHQLVARMLLDPAGMQKAVEDLRQNGDPVIALYLAMESVAPHSPQELLLLL